MTKAKEPITHKFLSERHDETARVAREIIEADVEAARNKTARLRAERIKQEASTVKPAKVAKAPA